VPWTVTVRTNRINQVQSSIQDRNKEIVRKSAKFMRDVASSIAPVDTGAFAASIYVNGPEGESDYALRADAAASLNPKAHIISEQQAAQATPFGPARNALGQFTSPQALVASAVEYSVYLEDGTKFMAPRPTFRPAAAATSQVFERDMRNIADGV
jgi:HK97 gp10 family phage protein